MLVVVVGVKRNWYLEIHEKGRLDRSSRLTWCGEIRGNQRWFRGLKRLYLGKIMCFIEYTESEMPIRHLNGSSAVLQLKSGEQSSLERKIWEASMQRCLLIKLLSESGDYVNQRSEDISLGDNHHWDRVEVGEIEWRNRGVGGQESSVTGKGKSQRLFKLLSIAESDTESLGILKFQQSED